MANDTTMPPSEQSDAPMPTGEMAPPQDPQGGQDGSVMISMPKIAFDAIHALVTQLASGIDQLKQGVDQQVSGSGAPSEEMPPAGPTGGQESPSGSDEDFLKGLAQEGSKK